MCKQLPDCSFAFSSVGLPHLPAPGAMPGAFFIGVGVVGYSSCASPLCYGHNDLPLTAFTNTAGDSTDLHRHPNEPPYAVKSPCVLMLVSLIKQSCGRCTRYIDTHGAKPFLTSLNIVTLTKQSGLGKVPRQSVKLFVKILSP